MQKIGVLSHRDAACPQVWDREATDVIREKCKALGGGSVTGLTGTPNS